MKINVLILILILISFEYSYSKVKLIPFEDGDYMGYKDKKGKIVLPARYRMAEKFSNYGIAAVADDSGWAYIDIKGNVLIRPCHWDNFPDEFCDGLARFEKDGKFGFFNQKAEIVIQNNYSYYSRFSGGLAAFCDGCKKEYIGEYDFYKGGKWGYIDKKGEIVIEPVYNIAYDFEKGKARVKKDSCWFEINKKGKVIKTVK
ncbi:MAG: WG repeat-containing protein [Ignavibacteriae bacterium]|nr:WG repeat-containing protein [Ignavibacteriota bacterium]